MIAFETIQTYNFFCDPLEQFEVPLWWVPGLVSDVEFGWLANFDEGEEGPLSLYMYEMEIAFNLDNLFDYVIRFYNSPLLIICLVVIGGLICIDLVVFLNTNVTVDSPTGSLKNGSFVKVLLKTILSIIKTILKSNTPLEKKEYYSVLSFLFFFILSCNIMGLIPFTFTITSSFIVTFFLAATHFIAINIIFIYRNGKDFYKIFLPNGVPQAIVPFLFVIEIISYIAKVFSLSIRLFANMMSGHALLKILIGFSWTMLSVTGGIFYGVAIFPWIIVTLILFLEILIAFLQAYVFVVLIAIYINDILSAH